MNKTNIIIGSAFLALIALFAFQTKWMTDSRNLIEEQFNQKVNMALTYAVGILDEKDEKIIASCATPSTASCLPIQEVTDGFQLETKNEVEISAIEGALDIAMNFYDIKMDYEVKVEEPQNLVLGCLPASLIKPDQDKLYSCSLNPLEKNESKLLTVIFPGKKEFIYSKMKFMFFSSIIILFFITLAFIVSSYTLIRQKRMQEISKEFFNNMAHEFRTPLTNISLAGSLLAKTQTSPKEARYLAVVKEESKKLATQVERILHLAK